MLTPQFVRALPAKLMIDLLTGACDASTGIEQASGRSIDTGINHDLTQSARTMPTPPLRLATIARTFGRCAARSYRRVAVDLLNVSGSPANAR